MRFEPTANAFTQRANRPVLSNSKSRARDRHKKIKGFGNLAQASGRLQNGLKYEVIETSYNPSEQVAQTIPILRRYIREDADTFRKNGFAGRLRAQYPHADPKEIALREAKRRLRFATDQDTAARAFGPEGLSGSSDWVPIEVLQRPVDVVSGSDPGTPVDGDCDDYTMFVCAVSLALDPDSNVQMVCVPADPSSPGVLSHIYASVDGVPVDASHGDFVGWEVPGEALTGPRQYFPVRGFGLFEIVAMSYFALNAYNILKQLRWIN